MKTKEYLWCAVVFFGLYFGIVWTYVSSDTVHPFFRVTLENQSNAVQDPFENQMSISVLTQDGGKTMILSDYIVAVVLGELPSDFSKEAVKAQAVAIRTVTLRLMEKGGKHEGFTVCTNPGCCQAYFEEKEYIQSGGDAQFAEMVKQAVAETEGEVIVHSGKLIDATYFSCSGGKTEAAVAVWGADVPYLQATDSPGEEYAEAFLEEKRYTVSEFCQRLQITPLALLSDPPGDLRYTEGGGIASMKIGGKEFTGTQLRSQLGLKSTIMTITVGNEHILISTKGFGHRVGMSQYGANAMAKEGYDYHQILHHYYRDVEICRMNPD